MLGTIIATIVDKILSNTNRVFLFVSHHFKKMIILLMIILLLAAFIAYELQKITNSLPNLKKLSNYEPALPTVIFSQDVVKIGELFSERRYPVSIQEMSPLIKMAFVAAEDSNFYNHHGIDWKGFVRASFHFLTFSGQKQGGSTITQQLAKNVLLSKERTIIRKIRIISHIQKLKKR